MTLLAPLAAAIGLAVAVPALLALYFLKLRRRAVRVSSTMLWDQASADLQVNVPWKMIRPSLLLLLHLLTLGCLIIAIGRPAVEGDWPTAERVFLVIDASGSMSASDRGDGVTRLDEAKRRAAELAERFAGASRRPTMTVIASAAGARVVAPPSADPGQVRVAIESIEPTDQPGDPAEAMELIAALTTGDADESGEPAGVRALAVYLSDGGDVDRPLAVPGISVRHELTGGPEPGRNIGITAVSAARDYDDPDMVRVFARLGNNQPLPAAVTLTAVRRGEVMASNTVRLPRASPEGPGEAAVTLSYRDPEAGVVEVGFDRPDALVTDDTAWLVVPGARRPSVLVVAPDDGADAFLMDVLEAMSLAAVRTVDAAAYAAAEASAIERYDLVIFDGVTPARLPGVPSLSFGALLPGLGDPDAAMLTGTTRVLSWDRRDPLVREARLGELLVGRRVVLPEADDRSSADVRMAELARGRDAPLIVALAGPPARVVVAFRVVQSNWALDYGFPIFLAVAVESLVSGAAEGQGAASWFRTTESAAAEIDGGAASMRISGPVERELTPTAAERAAGRITLGVLPRAGRYTVSGGVPVAVNMADAGETAAPVREAEAIEPTRNGETAAESGVRELWQLFVLAALGLLAIEWLVFARGSAV